MDAPDRKDIFEALVKLAGLWLFVGGIISLLPAPYYAWHVGMGAQIVGEYLVGAAPRILFGLLLVAKSGFVTRMCY